MSDFESRHSLPLARKIETATDSLESQPDEAAFLEICHHINQDKDGPAIALMAIINHLKQAAASDPKSAAFTLMLLDLCVKNCSYRFTRELCKDDYLETMKTLVDREDVAVGIHNRLLSLIQTWALAFSDNLDFKSIHDLYRELFNSGIKFPEINRNDIELLKHTLPPLQVLEAPRSAQRPAAANTRITYLMRAIRHDLDLTYLDLPAFEALLQGLSCNPPDSVTLKQLQTTADRLEGLQRRLEAYIGPLSEGMDPNSRSIQEEEATLDELIRVNEQINEGIQNFQSFERMRCREEEESRKALESNSAVANSEAVVGTRTAQPSATQAPWPAASSSLPPPLANTAHAHLAETNNVPRVTIQRTLFQAREILQQFQMLQRDKRKGSAQVINETPTEEFRAAFDRLEGMQKKVLELINEVVSAGIAEEDETVLANLMSVKDELMHCVERYQRAARGDQDCRKTRRETAEPPRAIEAGALTTATSSASTTSSSISTNSASSSSFSTLSSSTTMTTITKTTTSSGVATSIATPATGTHLAEAQRCLRKNIQNALDEAKETLIRFSELQKACFGDFHQPADLAKMAQFRDTGDRLGVIQKGIPPLIQGWREILRADSISVLEGDEALFNNLTRVNDELLLGIQNYQQATETLHLPHDEPATRRTQDVPSDEVRDLLNAIAPILENLQSANSELVSLLNERTQHHHSQITPQVLAQMQELVISIRENRQALSEFSNQLQDAISSVNYPDYVDRIMIEIINSTVNAEETLRRFEELGQQVEQVCQEDGSVSFTNGHEFNPNGS